MEFVGIATAQRLLLALVLSHPWYLRLKPAVILRYDQYCRGPGKGVSLATPLARDLSPPRVATEH